ETASLVRGVAEAAELRIAQHERGILQAGIRDVAALHHPIRRIRRFMLGVHQREESISDERKDSDDHQHGEKDDAAATLDGAWRQDDVLPIYHHHWDPPAWPLPVELGGKLAVGIETTAR